MNGRQTSLEQFSDVERKIIQYLSDHSIASPYEIAKNIGHSYSTVHVATKKLADVHLLTSSKAKSEKGGRKILFSLAKQAKDLVYTPNTSASVSFTISESTPNPLDDVMIDYLLSQRRENAEIDFKLTMDTSKESTSFPKICKDIFAMSNYGGGYLLFGFQEMKGTFAPVGIPSNFDFEQARVQEKFNAYSNEPLVIDYRVVTRVIDGQEKKFAIMYIPPSPKTLKPKKDGTYFEGGKQKKAFSTNDILIRRGSQSILASETEIEFISKRAQETDYRIGLIRGKPDRIPENLFGNFFEVVNTPAVIYEAKLPLNINFSFREIKDTPFIRQYPDTIFSFYDICSPPVGKYILSNSLRKYSINEFFENADLKKVLKRLLDSELKRAALDLGLKFDYNDRNVYFYPSEFQERTVTWEGRSRKSTRYVVRKLFLQQENTSIFVHSAAELSFRILGNDIFFEILPKIVLTYDGHNPINSSRQGPIKTRLTYNQFNDAYLNHVLFWASLFKDKNLLRLQIGKHILAFAQPVTVGLDVGIRNDRPALEFTKRRDELYSVEDLEVF